MPTLAELQPHIQGQGRISARRSGYRLDAEDLAQEGLLAAAQVLQQSADLPEEHLRARALTASRCAIISRARIETRSRASEGWRTAGQTQELPDADTLVDPSPGPDERVALRQMARLVAKASERLTPAQRMALEAGEMGEQREVAAALGVSPSRVSQLRKAAIERLRALLR